MINMFRSFFKSTNNVTYKRVCGGQLVKVTKRHFFVWISGKFINSESSLKEVDNNKLVIFTSKSRNFYQIFQFLIFLNFLNKQKLCNYKAKHLKFSCKFRFFVIFRFSSGKLKSLNEIIKMIKLFLPLQNVLVNLSRILIRKILVQLNLLLP